MAGIPEEINAVITSDPMIATQRLNDILDHISKGGSRSAILRGALVKHLPSLLRLLFGNMCWFDYVDHCRHAKLSERPVCAPYNALPT